MVRRLLSALACVLVVAAMAAGCTRNDLSVTAAGEGGPAADPQTPTTAPTTAAQVGCPFDGVHIALDPNAMVLAADPTGLEPLLQATARVRCLPPPPVVPQFIPRDEARKILDSTQEEDVRESAARLEPIAHLLGWIDPGETLLDALNTLTAGVVLGFYDPRTDSLYIVTETAGVSPSAQVTVSHEYVHAMQDARWDLVKLTDAVADDDLDGGGALSALVEGDATVFQRRVAEEYFSPEKRRRAANEQLAASPADLDLDPLVWDLYFAYLFGPPFVDAVVGGAGSPPLNDVYARPPRTSTEVLHPELYDEGFTAESVDAPNLAALLGPGWSSTFTGTWGEYSTANAISGFADRPPQTELATVDGWRGDRIELVRNEAGRSALGLATVWADDEIAARVASRAQLALGGDGLEQEGPGRWCGMDAEGRRTILVCTDAPTTVGRLEHMLTGVAATA